MTNCFGTIWSKKQFERLTKGAKRENANENRGLDKDGKTSTQKTESMVRDEPIGEFEKRTANEHKTICIRTEYRNIYKKKHKPNEEADVLHVMTEHFLKN